MTSDQNDPLERVRERIEDQAHHHWHEFSVIVASGNILLALILLGRILSTMHANEVSYLALGIALASILSAMLAYYSIQVGILFVVGALRLTELLVSFLIAAAQLALFLWPTHVLSVSWPSPAAEVRGLRQWLIFYSVFAFAGPFANWYAAWARRHRRPGLVLENFESSQRTDRLAGLATCALVLGCWALSFRWLTAAVSAGVTAAVIGPMIGIVSQGRVVERLRHSLANNDADPSA